MSGTTNGCVTLLVPVDLSPASAVALEQAARLATRERMTLILLHVLPDGPEIPTAVAFNRHFEVPEYRRQLQEDAMRDLEELAAKIPASPAGRRLMVVHGSPAESIVRVAAEVGADLIVIATNGRRGFSHALFGSVTEKVVRTAPCSVLCARPRREAALA